MLIASRVLAEQMCAVSIGFFYSQRFIIYLSVLFVSIWGTKQLLFELLNNNSENE